jgi:translation initiation factor 4G
LEYLLDKKVLTPRDIGTGCLLYGSMLDDVGIDLPKTPNNFGEIIGKLVLAGGLDFKVVNEILKKVEDDRFQKELVEAAIRVVSSTPFGQGVLDSQASDIEACQSLPKSGHVRFMRSYVLDLRSNNWVPRHEEVDILMSSLF